MKRTFTKLYLILPIFCLLNACDSGQQRVKTPEELRIELKNHELASSSEYLKDEGVYLSPQRKKIRNGGLFRNPEFADDGALIHGSIINSATLARYKDVEVIVGFYSQTETLIEQKTYVLYEYFEPNSNKQFSFKVYPPQEYANFSFQIVGATGIP